MTARWATACGIGVILTGALVGCSPYEPTEDDYLDTHIEFWTIAAEAGQESMGEPIRADLEEHLTQQWKAGTGDASTLRVVYDGVCTDLEQDERDWIFELSPQLIKAGVDKATARKAAADQVESIAAHLCPEQKGAAADVRKTLLEGGTE
ncbi:hypothetical protein [Microbacterium sp. NPDC057650]|uniref:hypothetical protein n=1 Tax=unclassified Microbacterium TaxID=2609290 RepID=UPI00366D3A21